jgi:hypothetical protein
MDLKKTLLENYKNREENHNEIFRYNMIFTREKILEGKFGFYVRVRIKFL